MATAANDLVVNLATNTTRWANGLASAQKDLTRFASGVKSTLLNVAAAAGAAFSAREVLGAAQSSIDAANRLDTALRATGGAAGLSAGEIKQFAAELQRTTNFEDDATVAAAALLATFRDIRGDTFKAALASAQDLAAFFGGDLEDTTLKLGKALQSPTDGLAKLGREGLKFSAAEHEKIAALEKSGDLFGAQAAILAAIQARVGGAARDLANPVVQLKNVLGDVAENIGVALLPTIRGLADAVRGTGEDVAGASEEFQSFGDWLRAVVVPPVAALVGVVREHGRQLLVLIGVYATYRAALRAAAIAQAVLTALQGPAGWAKLAAGLAIAGAATLALSRQFDGLEASAVRAAEATRRIGAEGGGTFIDELRVGPAKDAAELLQKLDQLRAAQEKVDLVRAVKPEHHLLPQADAAGRAGFDELLDSMRPDPSKAEQAVAEWRRVIQRIRNQPGLDAGQRAAAIGLAEDQIARISGVTDQLRALSEQIEVLKDPRSSIDHILRKAVEGGALPKQLDELRAKLKELEQAEGFRKMADDAKALAEQTRTPLEKFNAEIDRLTKLREAGAIGDELFGRGIAQAQDALQAAVGKPGKGAAAGGVAALQQGSREAFSAIQAAIRAGQEPDAAKKTAKNTEKAADVLARANEKLSSIDAKLTGGQGVPLFTIPGA